MKRESKLSPRGDGPFKVLRKVGDNAYVLELSSEYGVSPTFNVGDLSPYYPSDGVGGDSSSNPLQEGENDEGSSEHPLAEGTITRVKAKKLQQDMDELITFYVAKEPFLIEEMDEPPKTMITLCEPWMNVEELRDQADKPQQGDIDSTST